MTTPLACRPLPPFVVMERGESLDEWQRRCPADFVAGMHVMLNLVQRVLEIHKCGVVHRDLKPSNVIWYNRINAWTVIDLGSAAATGCALLPSTRSHASYAVSRALENGQKV